MMRAMLTANIAVDQRFVIMPAWTSFVFELGLNVTEQCYVRHVESVSNDAFMLIICVSFAIASFKSGGMLC